MKNPELRKGYDAVKAELNLSLVLQCRHSLEGDSMSTADSFIRVRLDKELKLEASEILSGYGSFHIRLGTDDLDQIGQ